MALTALVLLLLLLALLSGALSALRELQAWRQPHLDDLAGPDGMLQVPARSRLHCALQCQQTPACSSFFFPSDGYSGGCRLAHVVFSRPPCNDTSPLQHSDGQRYYVIQMEDEGKARPPGFRPYQAMGWLRLESWVANNTRALNVCASQLPGKTFLYTLPETLPPSSLGFPDLGRYVKDFLFVDGVWDRDGTGKWATRGGQHSSYSNVTVSSLGHEGDRVCLGINVTASPFHLTRVPCNTRHRQSASSTPLPIALPNLELRTPKRHSGRSPIQSLCT